jgi:hypothetical protein
MFDPPVPLPPALPATTRPAVDYARASLAPATLRAYQAGWQAFAEWCQLAGRAALPAAPETVAEHLASLATTLGRLRPLVRCGRLGHRSRQGIPQCRGLVPGSSTSPGAPMWDGTGPAKWTGKGRIQAWAMPPCLSGGHVGSPVFSA